MTSTGRRAVLAGSAPCWQRLVRALASGRKYRLRGFVLFPAGGPTTQRWSALVKAANIRLE